MWQLVHTISFCTKKCSVCHMVYCPINFHKHYCLSEIIRSYETFRSISGQEITTSHAESGEEDCYHTSQYETHFWGKAEIGMSLSMHYCTDLANILIGQHYITMFLFDSSPIFKFVYSILLVHGSIWKQLYNPEPKSLFSYKLLYSSFVLLLMRIGI